MTVASYDFAGHPNSFQVFLLLDPLHQPIDLKVFGFDKKAVVKSMVVTSNIVIEDGKNTTTKVSKYIGEYNWVSVVEIGTVFLDDVLLPPREGGAEEKRKDFDATQNLKLLMATAKTIDNSGSKFIKYFKEVTRTLK